MNQINAGHSSTDNHRNEGNDNNGDVNDLERRRKRLLKEEHMNRAWQYRSNQNGCEVTKCC